MAGQGGGRTGVSARRQARQGTKDPRLLPSVSAAGPHPPARGRVVGSRVGCAGSGKTVCAHHSLPGALTAGVSGLGLRCGPPARTDGVTSGRREMTGSGEPVGVHANQDLRGCGRVDHRTLPLTLNRPPSRVFVPE